MKRYRSVYTICLSLSLGLTSAAAQTAEGLNGGDPFKLERGRSFAASATRSAAKRETVPTQPAAVAILSDIDEALSIIRRNHFSVQGPDKLTRSSITSMLRSLDPHSDYYDADEFSSLTGSHAGEYSGTGSTIVAYEQNGRFETFVISTVEGSSAHRAGLRFGDRIVAVAGQPVSGRSSLDVRNLIRGKGGTAVEMVIERDAKTHIVTLIREPLPRPSIKNHFTLGDGTVGYIAMTDGFSNTTYDEFVAAMADLRSRGATSLVLDLRGNRGGIVEASVKVTEHFLPAGRKILTQRGRTRNDDLVWYSGNQAPETMPLTVIVDGQTASAAEIVAGALQDNDRALIVGEKTFGKGLVQNVIGLRDGSGITLTAARYYLPSGRSLQRDYSDAGLYDYYKQTNRAATIETGSLIMRTYAGRPVTGGDGISPDVKAAPANVTEEEASLIDPIFFFVVDRLSNPETRRRLEQNILVVPNTVGEVHVDEFAKRLAVTDIELIQRNRVFITQQLQYTFTLALFGTKAAGQVQASADAVITEATATLPQARQLASRPVAQK